MEINKICWMCKRDLPLSQYGNDKSRKDGKISHCKECHKEYNRKRSKFLQKNKPEILKGRRNRYRASDPIRHWCRQTYYGHKRNGYEVNFHWKDLYQYVKNIKYCFFCNCELDWKIKGTAHKNSPSVDRTDNEKHMNLKNIQILCRKCNATKQDRSMQEFINYCQVITNKFVNDTNI